MGPPHPHNPGLLSHSLGWLGTEAQSVEMLPHLLKIPGTAVGQTSKKREQCPERGKSPLSLKQTLERLLRQRFLKLSKCENHPRVFAKMCLPDPSQNDLFRNWVGGGEVGRRKQESCLDALPITWCPSTSPGSTRKYPDSPCL